MNLTTNISQPQITTYHYNPKLKNSSKITRVGAYARVSTLHEEQELSFETQCKYYEELYKNSTDKMLVKVYADHGVSGLSMENRTEFANLIEDCKNGEIDMIITKSVSRFSRNMSECVKVVQMLKSLSIPVFFEKENIVSTDPKNELFLTILSSLSQEESHSLSNRVKWAIQKRAEIGDPARTVAYGYVKAPKPKGQITSEGREWLIDESQAKRVKLAFEMASNRYPYVDIVNTLNNLEKAENTGVIWSQARLKYLLTNEAYKGDVLTHKTYVSDYLSKKQVVNNGQREQFYIEEHHAPIISTELFETVGQYVKLGYLCSKKRLIKRIK